MTNETPFKTIRGFNGEYRFLSNFYPCRVEFEGLEYPTVEHAYQAAKTNDNTHRKTIAGLTSAGDAKRAGRNLVLREDWEDVKVSIMLTLLRKKFYDPMLKAALLQTGNAELVEGNYWHDNFWGSCSCARCGNAGLNMLGKTLMETRAAIAKATGVQS